MFMMQQTVPLNIRNEVFNGKVYSEHVYSSKCVCTGFMEMNERSPGKEYKHSL